MPYSLNDPSNYYCLAVYIEELNEWKCVSRNLLDINDNIIEFNVPFPGIFAVIFSPKLFNKDENFVCDFICQYRKTLGLIFLFLIPLLFLSIKYIFTAYGK